MLGCTLAEDDISGNSSLRLISQGAPPKSLFARLAKTGMKLRQGSSNPTSHAEGKRMRLDVERRAWGSH